MKPTFVTQTTLGPVPHETRFVHVNGRLQEFHAPVCLRINRSKDGLLKRLHEPEVDGDQFVYALPGGETFRGKR